MGSNVNARVDGVEVKGPAVPGADRVLTPEALMLVGRLTRRFRAERDRLLALRHERQRGSTR